MDFVKKLFETSSTATQELLAQQWQAVYSCILTECAKTKQTPSAALAACCNQIQTLLGQPSGSAASGANAAPDYSVLREHLHAVKSELQKLQLLQSLHALLQQFEHALPNTTTVLSLSTVPAQHHLQPRSASAAQSMNLLALPLDIIRHGIFKNLGRVDSFSLFKSCRFFRTSKEFWNAIKDKPREELIAAGSVHTIFYDIQRNMLYSCGLNNAGQLGLGRATSQNTLQPLVLPKGKHVQKIAADGLCTIIQCTDGTVYGCGHNGYGQLGLGYDKNQNTLQPMVLPKGKRVRQIAAGGLHTIIQCTDGSVYGCGYNCYGQLGLGHHNNQNTLQPLVLPKGKHVQQIAAGEYHTIIQCTDGSVYGCGYNCYGQLGFLGHTTDQNTLQPLVLPEGKHVQQIAAGGYHTIIQCADGSLYGCGHNSLGELGLGYDNNQNTLQPLVLPEGKWVQQIAVGDHHTVVLCTDGTRYGWGSNAHGQLGLGCFDTTILQPEALPEVQPVELPEAKNGTCLVM